MQQQTSTNRGEWKRQRKKLAVERQALVRSLLESVTTCRCGIEMSKDPLFRSLIESMLVASSLIHDETTRSEFINVQSAKIAQNAREHFSITVACECAQEGTSANQDRS